MLDGLRVAPPHAIASRAATRVAAAAAATEGVTHLVATLALSESDEHAELTGGLLPPPLIVMGVAATAIQYPSDEATTREREMFGFHPQFTPNVISFDANNRPWLLTNFVPKNRTGGCYLWLPELDGCPSGSNKGFGHVQLQTIDSFLTGMKWRSRDVTDFARTSPNLLDIDGTVAAIARTEHIRLPRVHTIQRSMCAPITRWPLCYRWTAGRLATR
jgi:hypothetical protein